MPLKIIWPFRRLLEPLLRTTCSNQNTDDTHIKKFFHNVLPITKIGNYSATEHTEITEKEDVIDSDYSVQCSVFGIQDALVPGFWFLIAAFYLSVLSVLSVAKYGLSSYKNSTQTT